VNSDSPNTVEQANFSLTKVNNDKHALLALTDFHLAQRNADLTQFATFATDVNNTVTDLTKEGYRVYIMSMGDESWMLIGMRTASPFPSRTSRCFNCLLLPSIVWVTTIMIRIVRTTG
jgi:hypothetical protein